MTIYGVGPGRLRPQRVGQRRRAVRARPRCAAGHLTPAEFLDLNAKVGSWKPPSQMVQEGCPFIPATCADPAQFDPWSSRNMRLSPDGGVTPAPRTTGDRQAIAAAYESGLVFHGRHRHPDHRLAALPRGPAGHAQLPPVLRHPPADAQPRRPGRQPGHLVHRRPAGGRLRPDAGGAGRDRRVDGQHPVEPVGRRGREQAGARGRPLLHHRGPADRRRAARVGRHPRRPAGRARARRSSRSTARRGPSPAGRSRAASSPATGSPSRPLSTAASTAPGYPVPPNASDWSRSSRPACATTASGTPASPDTSGG